KRKILEAWEHLDKKAIKIVDGTEQIRVVCKYCTKDFVCGGNSGTNELCRYAQECVKRTTTDINQTIMGRNSSGEVFTFTFDQARETITYFVCEKLPFNKVQKPVFHRWIKNSFGPQFKPPCRTTMRNGITNLFAVEKNVLKENLCKILGKICFTSDMWTLNKKLGYLCLTTHFISNDLKLHKRIISFTMVPSPLIQVIFYVMLFMLAFLVET
ncbi:hypothetical protein GIB67_015468, partial [Kingdonia uniflora]